MAISTYAELQTALGNWSARSDLTSRLPEFITLSEAKMNRRLRTLDMETKNASFAISSEYVAVPTNFGGVRSFYLNTTPRQVLAFMPSDSETGYFGSNSGIPRYYTIEGSNFRFGPIPNGSYTGTLTYWLKIPALSGSNTTNWLLTSHPDAYVYAGMAELAAFVGDQAQAQAWTSACYSVLDEVAGQDARDKWGGTSMAVRIE